MAFERVGVEAQVKGFGPYMDKIDKMENKTSGFGSKIATVMKTGAVAGVAAVGALGAASLKMGMDFEKSLAEVRTLIPDISDEMFGKMRNDVLALSKEFGIATDKAVPALYQAISAGIPPENVIDFLKVGAKASIGGVTDLETAVDGLTTITNAWGLAADETGRVADVMFTGVKLGKTTMEELSASMFQAAPLAAALGISVEEVVAATATLTKTGVPTSVAMTQMRQAMVALTKPTADMATLLEETGHASGEALLEAEGFTGALGVLTEAADGNKEVLGKAFGSVEALGFVLGVTGENAQVAADDLAAVTDSAGASDEAFKTMSDTASFKLNKAINTVKVTMTDLGSKALPVIIKAIEKLSKFVKVKLLPPIQEFGTYVRTKIFPILKSLRDFFERQIAPVLREVGKVIQDKLMPPLKRLMKEIDANEVAMIAIGVVLAALVVSLVALAAPIAAVVAGLVLMAAKIALLSAVIALVISKKEEILNFFIGIGKAIKKFVDGVIQKVSDFPIIGEIIKDTVRTAKIYVETQLKIVQALFQAAVDTITNIFRFWKAVFTGEWGEAWNTVKDQAKVIWDLLSSLFGIALDAIKAMLASKLQMVMGIGSDLGHLIVDAAVGVWEGLKGLFSKNTLEALQQKAEQDAEAYRKIGETFAQYIVDEAKENWKGLKDLFSETTLKALQQKVEQDIEEYKQIGETFAQHIVDTAEENWGQLKGLFTQATLDSLQAQVTTDADGYKAIGETLAQYIVDAAVATWDAIPDLFETVVTAIDDALKLQNEVYKEVGETAAGYIVEGFGFLVDNVPGLVAEFTAAYDSMIDSARDEIKALGERIGKLIWDGIKSGIGSLGDLPTLRDVPGISGVLRELGLQRGAWSIPRTMRAILHPGEMVIPRGPAEAVRDTIMAPSVQSFPAAATGGGGDFNAYIEVRSQQEVASEVARTLRGLAFEMGRS